MPTNPRLSGFDPNMFLPPGSRGGNNPLAFLGGGGVAMGGGGGHNAFGSVPAPISVSPSTWSQTQSAIPGFAGLTQGTSDVIGSELSGNVSQATLNALKNASATWGQASGMGPGSNLGNNALFANIAGFSEGQQRKGLQDYLATTSTVGSQQTNPALATDVAARNANMAAAPDPMLAAKEQLAEWMAKFNLTKTPAGGTGVYSGQPRGGRPPDGTVHIAPGGKQTDALGFPVTNTATWWGDQANPPAVGALPDRIGQQGNPYYSPNEVDQSLADPYYGM